MGIGPLRYSLCSASTSKPVLKFDPRLTKPPRPARIDVRAVWRRTVCDARWARFASKKSRRDITAIHPFILESAMRERGTFVMSSTSKPDDRFQLTPDIDTVLELLYDAYGKPAPEPEDDIRLGHREKKRQTNVKHRSNKSFTLLGHT